MINRFIIFLCLLTIVVACSEENANTNVEIIAKNLPSKVGDSMLTVQPTWNFYDPYKDLTNKEVLSHYNNVLKKRADSIRKNSVNLDSSFYQALSLLWPAWYNTKWDFNGYTEKPRNGVIACGYFVSTTLRDAGLKINRFTLAKKYSHAICLDICGDNLQKFTIRDSLISYIKGKPNDIYIVGLDNHVGFLQKENNEVFFVHSNYLEPVAVVKEIAMESEALGSSNVYILGSVLENKTLLKDWKSGNNITLSK